jgi:hypothetical protein
MTLRRPCITCGRLTEGSYCAQHEPSRRTPGRSGHRQAGFRDLVLARAGHRCQYLDQGQRCTATEGLEAHHLVQFREEANYDPTAGVALCPEHHREVERRQHEQAMRAAGELAWRAVEHWSTPAGRAESAERKRRARL